MNRIVLVAALLAAPAVASAQGLPRPSVPASVAGRFTGPVSQDYVVVPGDCLSWIAERAGVSLGALEAANPQFASNWNLIYPGNVVRLPAGASMPSGGGLVRLTQAYSGPVLAGGTIADRAIALADNAANPDGIVNRNTGNHDWSIWCLALAATAYRTALGHDVPDLVAGDARGAYLQFLRDGLITPWNGANPPRGAVIFWDYGPASHGHVAISNGDGTVVSNVPRSVAPSGIDPHAPILSAGRPAGWVAPNLLH